MPGILPMKVIKVGNNSQPRIAQACDRCRSKKIRCDGIRPSCTQCLNVGFECKTSDKLSRRAFPRGYTESLEERVRCLESEVRELKMLLDEKDEKIDMLSRIHSHSHANSHPSPSVATPRTLVASPTSLLEQKEDGYDREEVFKVLQTPSLAYDNLANAYFAGTSNARTVIDAFKSKVQASGRTVDVNTKSYLFTDREEPAYPEARAACIEPPGRLVSDQLVNIFFQEWAPLFPILNRPAFLNMYENFIASPEGVQDKKAVAQLYLVFSIAAQSCDARQPDVIDSWAALWQGALETFPTSNDLVTLQCLTLAQIHCLQKSDHARLLKYKGLAVTLSHRLGLHQSQKRFGLGALTSETRKKVFWSLYTLDCVSAAELGLPMILNDADVHCEYPVDADDEYVTENGFLPTLPGESTKLSSALAMFRLARVLSRTLAQVYPASAAHEISLRTVASLSSELDAWLHSLPPHLRLQFVQDKPSVHVVSSRSPILSLAYNYVRSMIVRPVVCASTALGDRATTALVTLCDASKKMIQVVELLEERNLSFSFCLNKDELLVSCVFGILFQGVDLDPTGVLLKDNVTLINKVVNMLEQWSEPVAAGLQRLSNQALGSRFTLPDQPAMSMSQDMQACNRQFHAINGRFSGAAKSPADTSSPAPFRRATMNSSVDLGMKIKHDSHHSSRSEPSLSPASRNIMPATTATVAAAAAAAAARHGFPIGANPQLLKHLAENPPFAAAGPGMFGLDLQLLNKQDMSTTEWQRILSTIDNGQTTIYDTIYGGPGASPSSFESPAHPMSSPRAASKSAPNNLEEALSNTTSNKKTKSARKDLTILIDEDLCSVKGLAGYSSLDGSSPSDSPSTISTATITTPLGHSMLTPDNWSTLITTSQSDPSLDGSLDDSTSSEEWGLLMPDINDDHFESNFETAFAAAGPLNAGPQGLESAFGL